LEDLNSRGLLSSPTEVSNSQAQALKELELGNQKTLSSFDTNVYDNQQNLYQQGLGTILGGQQDALNQVLSGQQFALDTQLGGDQSALDAYLASLDTGVQNQFAGSSSALEAALNSNRAGLQRTFDLADAAREESRANYLANKSSRNQLVDSLIGAGSQIAPAVLGGSGSLVGNLYKRRAPSGYTTGLPVWAFPIKTKYLPAGGSSFGSYNMARQIIPRQITQIPRPAPQIQLNPIQLQKPQVPVDQIIQVLGQNPVASGIKTGAGVLAQAMQRRNELRKQAAQVQALEGSVPALGMRQGTLQGLSPELATEALKQNVELAKVRQPKTEELPPVYVIRKSGKIYDAFNGQEITKMDPTRKYQMWSEFGTGVNGSVQQTQFVDSSDGIPLLFDRANKMFVRSDNMGMPTGKPVPMKGNQDATQSASRGAELLPKIDQLFNSLARKSDFMAKASVAPGLSKIAFPETNQLKNEVKQIGFTFGGKNFTGNEEKIITDALIPGVFDNDESREAKRKALKGYISGQINLLEAANLLGASGAQIKQILGRNQAGPSGANNTGGWTPDDEKRFQELQRKHSGRP
jgi:hypothetical protein